MTKEFYNQAYIFFNEFDYGILSDYYYSLYYTKYCDTYLFSYTLFDENINYKPIFIIRGSFMVVSLNRKIFKPLTSYFI